jgi:hypothetical protein
MSIRNKIPFMGGSNAYDQLGEALAAIRGGDHDALALLPYDDGTYWLKPCSFDKELIGGQGGYETEDGDKIILDGDGEPKRDLLGVPIILAVDPTEHAAAVDPIKALVAQKNNIGEWLRVDREGNIVEIGDALKQAAASAVFEDPDSPEHWTAKALEYHAVRERIEAMGVEPDDASAEAIERAVRQVEQAAAEQAQQADDASLSPRDYLPWGDEMDGDEDEYPDPIDVDLEASMVGDKLREMGIEPGMASDEMRQQVMQQLAEQGDLRKIYDIAPPAAPAVADGGGVELEQATHIAVDQSKAADLLPTTTNTTELQTAIDKARNEEYDEGKAKELITYGIIIGAVIGGVFAVLMALMFALV